MQVAEDGETYVPMPPLHLPLLATLGAWLAVIGWLGWGLGTPTYVASGLNPAWIDVSIGLMLAASGGAMVSLAYSWLTTGQGNALMTARGVLGAIVAGSAGLPFLPLWAALAVGAGAGLLVPLGQYLIEHLLRLDDPTSAVATHGLPALWGLLAVGLFADGHAGQGWNRVGQGAYLGVAGQGVTGYLAGSGYASDWPAQFQAQATGAIAILFTAFFASWLLYAAIQGLTRAWQGEYTVRLPKRRRVRRPRSRRAKLRGPRIRFVRAEASQSGEDAKRASRSMFTRLKSLGGQARDQVVALVSVRRRVQRAGQAESADEPGKDTGDGSEYVDSGSCE
jgi:hypothetical protein